MNSVTVSEVPLSEVENPEPQPQAETPPPVASLPVTGNVPVTTLTPEQVSAISRDAVSSAMGDITTLMEVRDLLRRVEEGMTQDREFRTDVIARLSRSEEGLQSLLTMLTEVSEEIVPEEEPETPPQGQTQQANRQTERQEKSFLSRIL